MLVLSRQRDEQIIMIVPPSDKPTIILHTTVDVRGDKVRHGIDAPPGVEVHRMEVYDAIQKETGAETPAEVLAWIKRGRIKKDAYVSGKGK